MTTNTLSTRANTRTYTTLGLAAILWYIAYTILQPATEYLAYNLLGLQRGSPLGDAVAFFLYDVPKILLLLAGMIFLITIVRTFFSAERTRQLLGGKRVGVGNVLAAMLGIVTPFCSCSAVPGSGVSRLTVTPSIPNSSQARSVSAA